MSLSLPGAPDRYDPRYEARRNSTLEQEDLRNRKTTNDVECAGGTRLILYSPNGSRWSITVSDAGAITAVAL